jgi:hypothetical protein
MCIHYLHHIHPPAPFFTTSSLSPVPTTPPQPVLATFVLL